MVPAGAKSRPGTVTIAVVLLYLGGIAQMVAGTLTIFIRYTANASGGWVAETVTLLGAAIILFGLLVIALASGVARGSWSARLTCTIILLLGAIVTLASVSVSDGQDNVSAAVRVATAIAVILLLWLGAARRYFVRAR
jgi:hypothetical protein